MGSQSSERRQFNRALFTIDDGVIGILSVPELQKAPITAYLLNLSVGGMYFTLRTEEKNKIKEGDHLVLIQIKGSASLKFLVNIDAEIRWILNYENFEHVGIGCKFLNIPESSRKQVGKFVDSWYGLNHN